MSGWMVTALLPLTGCIIVDASARQAEVDVCTDGSLVVGDGSGDRTATATGDLVGPSEGACEGMDLRWGVETGDGVVTFGVAVRDDTGPVLPPDALSGVSAATCTYVEHLGFGTDEGLLVRDDAGALVLAVDGGRWGGALAPTEVPELTVSFGDVVARERTGCEPREHRQIVFEADDRLDLVGVSSGILQVDGTPSEVWNLGAYTWGDGFGCTTTDLTDRMSWAIVR